MKKGRWVLFALVAFSCISGGFIFAEEKPSSTAPPSARMMIGELSQSVDVKLLAAQVKDTSSPAYDFTTGISGGKGYFKIGVLMTDLAATVRAGEREKVSKVVRALADGLPKVGAQKGLVESVINLGTIIDSGIDLQAVNEASLPLIEPFIQFFSSLVGKTTYLRFGEWVELTRIVALAGEQGKVGMAADFIKKVDMADYFLKEFKDKGLRQGGIDSPTLVGPKDEGLPQGVIDSLKTIAETAKNSEVREEEVKKTLKAINIILMEWDK